MWCRWCEGAALAVDTGTTKLSNFLFHASIAVLVIQVFTRQQGQEVNNNVTFCSPAEVYVVVCMSMSA